VNAANSRDFALALAAAAGCVTHEMLLRVDHLPQFPDFAQLACLQLRRH
jgi:hypothetical protein